MHTHETEHGTESLGASAKSVAERASALVRLEMELAALELKRKVVALGAGIGLSLGAGLFLVFALWFGFAAAAAGLATTLSVWLSLLIVGGILLLLTAVLGGVAFLMFKRGTPPVPEQAIREAQLTGEALRSDGSH
jgi:hypothetical protein